jgi:hypothetical protein
MTLIIAMAIAAFFFSLGFFLGTVWAAKGIPAPDALPKPKPHDLDDPDRRAEFKPMRRRG